MKNFLQLSIIIIFICSFINSQEIIKSTVMYDPECTRRDCHEIRFIHYFLKYDTKIIRTKSEHFFKSGSLMGVEHYNIDGEVDGMNNWYYESGQTKSIRFFKDGKRDGKWMDYYDDRKFKEDKGYDFYTTEQVKYAYFQTHTFSIYDALWIILSTNEGLLKPVLKPSPRFPSTI